MDTFGDDGTYTTIRIRLDHQVRQLRILKMKWKKNEALATNRSSYLFGFIRSSTGERTHGVFENGWYAGQTIQ